MRMLDAEGAALSERAPYRPLVGRAVPARRGAPVRRRSPDRAVLFDRKVSSANSDREPFGRAACGLGRPSHNPDIQCSRRGALGESALPTVGRAVVVAAAVPGGNPFPLRPRRTLLHLRHEADAVVGHAARVPTDEIVKRAAWPTIRGRAEPDNRMPARTCSRRVGSKRRDVVVAAIAVYLLPTASKILCGFAA